jgi:transposase
MNLWSKKGQTWLGGLDVPSTAKVILELHRGQIELLTDQIDTLEKELDRIGQSHPGVQGLTSIPGVGMRTAEAVVAYIDDVRRFSKIRCVGSYFGLVPCQDSSANRNRLGHITKDGPAIVRKLLCEATHVGIRRSPKIRSFYDQVVHGDPDRKKIAIVATAHHLVRVMAAMLRSGQIWQEDEEGRPGSTPADREGLSPPEDTGRVTALSSVGG